MARMLDPTEVEPAASQFSRIIIFPFKDPTQEWKTDIKNWRSARQNKIAANKSAKNDLEALKQKSSSEQEALLIAEKEKSIRTDLEPYVFFDLKNLDELKINLKTYLSSTQTIYITGHCNAGSNTLHKTSENASTSISTGQLAKLLCVTLELNENFAGKIKIYACNSAVPSESTHSFAYKFALWMRILNCKNCEIYGYTRSVVNGYVGAHKIATDDTQLLEELNQMMADKKAFSTKIDPIYNEDHKERAKYHRKKIILDEDHFQKVFERMQKQ